LNPCAFYRGGKGGAVIDQRPVFLNATGVSSLLLPGSVGEGGEVGEYQRNT